VDKFKVGQPVRFIRDSTDGGRTYGAKGDTAIVLRVNSPASVTIKLDKKGEFEYQPSAYIADLASITPEDTFEKDGIE
jgi:hypothetical protein